jgi:hypothetical protein
MNTYIVTEVEDTLKKEKSLYGRIVGNYSLSELLLLSDEWNSEIIFSNGVPYRHIYSIVYVQEAKTI